MSAARVNILAMLPATAREIADELGISLRCANARLQERAARGLVKRDGKVQVCGKSGCGPRRQILWKRA